MTKGKDFFSLWEKNYFHGASRLFSPHSRQALPMNLQLPKFFVSYSSHAFSISSPFKALYFYLFVCVFVNIAPKVAVATVQVDGAFYLLFFQGAGRQKMGNRLEDTADNIGHLLLRGLLFLLVKREGESVLIIQPKRKSRS